MSADEISEKAVLEDRLLSTEEAAIILTQIRKNTVVIEDYVERLDLIVNKEGHRRHESFVARIRERLYLLMEENDTFREVYWKHFLEEDLRHRKTCRICRF